MSEAHSFQNIPAVIGYVTPLRGRPGDRLEFKVSSRENAAFSARVVRIDCADPNPAGPGIKYVPVDFGLDPAPQPGVLQAVRQGSYGLADVHEIKSGSAWQLDICFQNLLDRSERQAIASLQDSSGTQGLALVVAAGRLQVFVWNGLDEEGSPVSASIPAETTSELAVDRGKWYAARVCVEPDRGLMVELQDPFAQEGKSSPDVWFAPGFAMPDNAVWTRLVVAGALLGEAPSLLFNGRIEAPMLSLIGQAGAKVIAAWDFSKDIQASSVPDLINSNRRMQLFNAPMRAVRGVHWSGHHMDWKTRPEEYAAIHFHEDDLADCDWQTSILLEIPQHTESAVYGLVVDNGAGQDTIPFFVLPPDGGPYAPVAYLASTLTYIAYGNHARGNYEGGLAERIADWGGYPHHPDVVTQFGKSTYDRHPDGSGISLSSRHRPLLTMRPGYLTFPDPNGSGLRHFPADSHLTDWLRVKGIPFDVITDEDLHEQGADVLAPYQVVLTGSHPEYHTRQMLEALQAYRRNGGHFAYLGGNGFYWKIAVGGDASHLLEVRRAEGGVRAWASEPGEYYHQLDGEYGGLWRRNGIPPQMIGGVGFTVQGEFEGSHYRRTPESYDTSVSWLFEGVEDETFGGFGLSGGGAAGFELDQTDPLLGTPVNAVVIAVSEGHGGSFMTVPEEILTWTLRNPSERRHQGICAHMAYAAPHDGWGALFTTGSITFTGSLSHSDYSNDVSTILENYLRHFLAPARNS